MGVLNIHLASPSSTLTFLRSRHRQLFYAGLVSTVLIVLWCTLLVIPKTRYVGRRDVSLEAIGNETLGFEKIFCINLPSRTDKRDAIVLGSSITQFRVDWIDGVSAADMSPKAYPPRFDEPDRPRMLDGEIGSWRAHVNAIQTIVSSRVSSALILEDDVDWDVTLKNQLKEFALGSRALQSNNNQQQTTRTPSPYGTEWDVLWLGHCGTKCHRNNTSPPFYILKNDPTSTPVYALPRYFVGPAIHELVDNIKHSRLICRSAMSVCSSAYALSFHGAQELLAALSVAPSDEGMPAGESVVFDMMLGRLCSTGYLRCVASHPAVFGNWRAAGLPSKQSDIQYNYDGPKEGRIVQGPSFQGVVFSTMANLEALLEGERVVKAGVKDVVKSMVDLDTVKVREGGLHRLDYEEMVLKRVG
ncbi:hypothetical protein BO71DRAFT_380233 [Aspergillus ellipticus CBS 707.79]|uniref:Glycosyl transferase family 25 domain-containing protein n=1 Tax=Aspergillus ellipticus CBS 707.79 TaxID=1448320 RepID=A0A319DRW4_9EURO|nr:hypothetical protein BO71DRAFT_380233 [Aspergillus ellipticus CBS 707.79]